MSRILVAYFSAGGTTAAAAHALARAEDADLFEIRPVTPYTARDLDWTDKHSRSSLEMADPNCRPPIAERVADMDRYDTVFVGFPIWWGREPSVVDTFLNTHRFEGKKIIPFCTSGGSGIRGASDRIRILFGYRVEVDEGKRLGGTISEEDLETWMNGLGL